MTIDKTLKSPAILLGNGLNIFSKLPISWLDLLINISNNRDAEKILNARDISYPEFYDAVCFNNGKGVINYQSLKKNISEEIKKWHGNQFHETFINFARNNKIPVLTTNYALRSLPMKYSAFIIEKERKDMHSK